jgi:hypothetical protein
MTILVNIVTELKNNVDIAKINNHASFTWFNIPYEALRQERQIRGAMKQQKVNYSEHESNEVMKCLMSANKNLTMTRLRFNAFGTELCTSRSLPTCVS